MIIAVASGKGGTGKTTVATSLATVLSQRQAGKTAYLDCDVEEPDAALFLHPDLDPPEPVGIPVPKVDPDLCIHCGRCADVCEYNAMTVVGRQVLIFPEMCHGCGNCTLNCPQEAITERLHVLGDLQSGRAGPDNVLTFGQGMLRIGQAMAVPVIQQLKDRHIEQTREGAVGKDDVVVLDAPAGTSCPVVEVMRGSDFVLLVTEPTPFGLHDLRLAVEVARDELDLPVGVVINRDGVGDDAVERYCEQQGVPILMRIPLDRRIAAAVSGGQTLVEALPEYEARFEDLLGRIQKTREATA